MVVALPALRLRDLYLALASIAFALIATNLIFAQPELFADPRRLDPVPGLADSRYFLVYTAVVYAVLALALVGIRRSRYGRRVVAMRDSEAAAACLGLNATTLKAGVFALGGAVSGVGGGLLAQGQRFISAEQFPMIAGLTIILSLMVMGVGTTSGPIVAGRLGAVLLALSQDWAPGQITHALELFGPALAVLALAGQPRGQIPVVTARARLDPRGTVVRVGGFALVLALGTVAGVPALVTLALAVAAYFAIDALFRRSRRPTASPSPTTGGSASPCRSPRNASGHWIERWE